MSGKTVVVVVAFAVAAQLGFGASPPLTHAAAPPAKRADFRGAPASRDVRHIADWAVHSGDHKGLPFLVLDKVEARLFAFDEAGRLIRAVPVLLGTGIGDKFAPGVAEMDMFKTKPWQRVTPAGRFLAEPGRDLKGKPVLWVDYDSGIAIHKLTTQWPEQRRKERLASLSPSDNRITYGCINVPVDFYTQVIEPYFHADGRIVYALPEERAARDLFGSYDVSGRTSSRKTTAP